MWWYGVERGFGGFQRSYGRFHSRRRASPGSRWGYGWRAEWNKLIRSRNSIACDRPEPARFPVAAH